MIIVFVKELSISLTVHKSDHLCLYTKHGAVKKNEISKMNSEYLEKYVWIYTHVNDLDYSCRWLRPTHSFVRYLIPL